MSKKSFQVRRTPPLYPTDIPQKPFESNLRVYRQTISNDPNIMNQKVTQNKPAKEVVMSDNTPSSNSNSLLPKSAPSNPTKRVLRLKGEIKDVKEVQKKSYGLGMITNYADTKSTEQIKTTVPSKSTGGIIEEGIKSRSLAKREKTAGGKTSIVIRTNNGEKRDESPTGLDASVINGMVEDNKDGSPKYSEDFAKQEEGQASPGKNETEHKFYEFTLSRIPPEREGYQEKYDNEMIKMSREALGEDESNMQKLGGNLRGVFMKEHIPRSELQKQSEQKRLMKEILDSQLDEKKRRREEERKREMEMEKREEERIKKEIKAIEQRLEKETNYDSKLKNNKNQPNQIPDLKGRGSAVKTSNKDIWEKMSRDGYKANLSPVQTPEPGPRNSYHLESQLKSPERKEFMEGKSREIQKSFKGEPVIVDKLVQENKHLRDENIKKKEIIDMLISALNKNKDQNGLSVIPEQVPQRGSPLSGNHPRNISALSFKKDYFDPFSNSEAKPIKDRDVFYNPPLSNKNDFENRSIHPLYGRQADEHKYLGDPRSSDVDIMEMPRKTSSGQIKNESYNIFQPQPAQRDAESAQSHFRFGPSPRLGGQAIRNGVYSSGAIVSGYNNDLKRSSIKNKNGFLPQLSDSPNGQVLYHRPNVQSMDINYGTNNPMRNLDTSKFLDSPVRKDREVNMSVKNGYSDNNLAMRDSSFKLGNNDNLSGQKIMFDDIVYPSSTYMPSSYSNANFSSIKKDHGILVIDEGGSRVGASQLGKTRELDPLMVRQAKSQGMLVGLSGISMVDMANSPAYNGVRMSEKSGLGDSEGVRLYAREFGGISERGMQAQTTMNKGKFPKEVFGTNVKKKFFV